MDEKVVLHFQSVDPVLFSAIRNSKPFTIEKSDDYFSDLVEAIICQQLSDKAGATIFGRFQKLFPKEKITPEQVLSLTDLAIRNVGSSWSKVRYIKNIAQATVDNTLNLNAIDTLTNEEIIKELTKIKGIGPWTAEMFLMFTLGREDVFSHGDLGLNRAIQNLYHFKKEPTRKQIEKISRKWSPYRTWACLLLWRTLD
ncbi:DNA-3-methyladenine glycosylase 2 family protein [Candidatus Gottesmanbacteria bacterium]|nr:DNA-3-methyladenine glycosylase 2 family protein [Candidatus Gottesmanbacteria bacterium]